MVRKAVIPVAGHGTRFLPITKSIPKEMLPIVDKPNLQYIVEEAINSGIEEILIVSCHEKPEIEEYFTENFTALAIIMFFLVCSFVYYLYDVSRK